MKSMLKKAALLPLVVLALHAGAAHAGPKEDIEADMQAGRWSQAESRLQAVVAKNPKNAQAHYWLAQVEYHEGKYAAASAEAHRAIEIDPSEKFTTDTAVLAKLLSADAHAGTRAAAPAVVNPPPLPAAPAPKPSRGFPWGWLLVLGVVGFLVWRVVRSTTGVAASREREQWRGQLRQAYTDLQDAVAASDANPQLTPETKLANYDRANKMRSALQAHEASLASRNDFGETAQLVARAHDVAAELRGEEPPSVRRARIEEQRAGAPVIVQQGGYGYGPGGSSGALGTVGAVGAGVVAGMLLEEVAHAGEHRSRPALRDDEGWSPAPADDRSLNVDVGGSDAGAGWDSGSSDGGGMDFGGGDSGSWDS
jgi:hypothetical protein